MKTNQLPLCGLKFTTINDFVFFFEINFNFSEARRKKTTIFSTNTLSFHFNS